MSRSRDQLWQNNMYGIERTTVIGVRELGWNSIRETRSEKVAYLIPEERWQPGLFIRIPGGVDSGTHVSVELVWVRNVLITANYSSCTYMYRNEKECLTVRIQEQPYYYTKYNQRMAAGKVVESPSTRQVSARRRHDDNGGEGDARNAKFMLGDEQGRRRGKLRSRRGTIREAGDATRTSCQRWQRWNSVATPGTSGKGDSGSEEVRQGQHTKGTRHYE